MSLKIFSYKILGKIKPVEKIESHRHSLYKDYLEYLQIEESDELKEFIELEKFVNSTEFKDKKSEIEQLGFKGSNEEDQLKEYETLKKDGKIKKYFIVKDSPDLKRFEAIGDSDMIREYYHLAEFIDNGYYAEQKEEIAMQVYKGSDEEEQEKEFAKLEKMPQIKAYVQLNNTEIIARHDIFAKSDKLKRYTELKNLPEKDKSKRREYKSLRRDAGIKSYLKFERSKKLKLYREAVDSYHLKRYLELKAIVGDEEFKKRVAYLKDKKKFEKSEAYKKSVRLKKLSKSDDVKFYLRYKTSKLLKNYYDVGESDDLKRFLELKDIISSDDYKKRKAYLEDPKKWEKSEEYAKEQKYLEMNKRPHLIKFFSYQGTDAFDFFRDWEINFEDDFSGDKIDSEKWSLNSLLADKTLGQNFSIPGDLQVFTNGANVRTGGKMVIETRKEKQDGMIWQMPAGFIKNEFDYTSGLVSTGKSFWQNDGIFEARIRFRPVREVVSSIILQNESNSPRVHLLEMGAKNRIGISDIDAKGKLKMNGLDISNLTKGKWYIFTLHKAGNIFTWKINDTEVLQIERNDADLPLHINFLSIVVNQIPRSKLPVKFEVNWVKCYKKKG